MLRFNRVKYLLLNLLSFILLVIVSVSFFASHHTYQENSSIERLTKLRTLSQQVVYLDEVLTMSARMGAYSLDPQWEARYWDYFERFELVMKQIAMLDPAFAERIMTPDFPGTSLEELEEQAFELIRAGETELALERLFNNDYVAQKKLVAEILASSITRLENQEVAIFEEHNEHAVLFRWLLILTGLVFLCSWLLLLVYIRQNDAKVEQMAVTDQLSGLANRRLFDDKLRREINRCLRQNDELMLAILDIDFFKAYNDNYGHPQGDKVLAAVGHLLLSLTQRETEMAFRIGGEEFAIIIDVADKQQGREYIATLRDKLDELAMPHQHSVVKPYITASIGLSFLSDHRTTYPGQLYRQADQALYLAKQQGRDRACEYLNLIDEPNEGCA